MSRQEVGQNVPAGARPITCRDARSRATRVRCRSTCSDKLATCLGAFCADDPLILPAQRQRLHRSVQLFVQRLSCPLPPPSRPLYVTLDKKERTVL